MRSIDKAWAIARAKNKEFPAEFLGGNLLDSQMVKNASEFCSLSIYNFGGSMEWYWSQPRSGCGYKEITPVKRFAIPLQDAGPACFARQISFLLPPTIISKWDIPTKTSVRGQKINFNVSILLLFLLGYWSKQQCLTPARWYIFHRDVQPQSRTQPMDPHGCTEDRELSR